MIKWIRANAKVVFISFTIGFILAVFTAPKPAAAMELNAAWQVLREGITATTPQKVYIAAEDSTRSNTLPSAYMIWEKSGNPIKVRRFYANVAETNWIDIPDGQSLVIPAPPAYRRTGSTAWWHKMAFIGAAGDTVLYLPMKQ